MRSTTCPGGCTSAVAIRPPTLLRSIGMAQEFAPPRSGETTTLGMKVPGKGMVRKCMHLGVKGTALVASTANSWTVHPRLARLVL